MNGHDLEGIKRLPIKTVAKRLGIRVLRGNKAMCFGGHDKNTPSLSFNQKGNYWYCFGCGLGGDGIKLVESVLRVGFKESLDWLSNQFGLGLTNDLPSSNRRSGRATQSPHVLPPQTQPPNDPMIDFSPDPTIYSWLLAHCGQVVQPQGQRYLVDHGIPFKVANRFGICELQDPERAYRSLIQRYGNERLVRSGLAFERNGQPTRLIWTSYALLFPSFEGSTPIYIQGRQFAGRSKYINLRGVKKPLFNADRLKLLTVGARVHICEGVADAVALEALDLPAVAVLGASSFREEWTPLFMPFQIAIVPDGDNGGAVFSRKVSTIFRGRSKSVLIVTVPPGKDVAEMAAEMANAK
jgi:DNA primase